MSPYSGEKEFSYVSPELKDHLAKMNKEAVLSKEPSKTEPTIKGLKVKKNLGTQIKSAAKMIGRIALGVFAVVPCVGLPFINSKFRNVVFKGRLHKTSKINSKQAHPTSKQDKPFIEKNINSIDIKKICSEFKKNQNLSKVNQPKHVLGVNAPQPTKNRVPSRVDKNKINSPVNIAGINKKKVQKQIALPPIGLPNGFDQQRCFVNVTLQMIVHTPALRQHFENDKYPELKKFIKDYSRCQSEKHNYPHSKLPKELMDEIRTLIQNPARPHERLLMTGKGGDPAGNILLDLLKNCHCGGIQKINRNNDMYSQPIINGGFGENSSLEETIQTDLASAVSDIPDHLVVRVFGNPTNKIPDHRTIEITDKNGQKTIYECTFCACLIQDKGQSHWVAVHKVGDQWYKIDDRVVTVIPKSDVTKYLALPSTCLNYQKKV